MATKKRITKRKVTTIAKIGKKTVKKITKKKGAISKGKAVKVKVRKVMAIKNSVPARLDKISKPYTKSELYRSLAERSDLTRSQISSIFDELSNIIKLHLQKNGPEKFILPGMLKMVIKNIPARKAHKGINPFTGEPTIFKAKSASKKVKVAALKALKDLA